MNKPSFITLFIGSFYKPEVYQAVATRKGLNPFVYMILLVLLCSLPVMVSLISGAEAFFKGEGKFILSQMPTIRIENGQASMDRESPYTLRTQEGKPLAVIDLSDSAEFRGLPEGVSILLTRNKLIAKQSETETRAYDLSKMQHFTLDQATVTQWLEYAWVVYILIFVFILIGLYVYRIVQALFNALIGLILSALLKVRMDYEVSLRIALLAITPVAVAAAILWSVDFSIPGKGWIGFLMAVGYLAFGILANKKPAGDLPMPGTDSVSNENGENS
jgi:hypothetical protein